MKASALFAILIGTITSVLAADQCQLACDADYDKCVSPPATCESTYRACGAVSSSIVLIEILNSSGLLIKLAMIVMYLVTIGKQNCVGSIVLGHIIYKRQKEGIRKMKIKRVSKPGFSVNNMLLPATAVFQCVSVSY